MAWIACFLMLLAGAALLVMELHRRHRQVLMLSRLRGQSVGTVRPGLWGGLLQRLAESDLTQRALRPQGETRMLLSRMGWRRPHHRALFMLSLLLTPLTLVALTLLVQALSSEPSRSPWVAVMMAVGCGALLPKRLLVWLAERRKRLLLAELTSFVPLLRILFDAGLTVEQSMRVLSQDGQRLTPLLSGLFRQVLTRVDAGAELGDELGKIGQLLDVDELRDCLTILQQLLRQGGGAMSSLLALKQLLDDRRLTGLQEYISKLSAKMAVVMMVFLFPALLIVLAGPGLSAIGRALGSASQ
ncbi:Bacterial type II secretion system protein F domain protein [compost metagenome]